MQSKLEVHPEAIAEAAAASLWYRERSATAADAFLQEIDLAIERILEAPERWSLHSRGTRRYVMRRFPFSVIYFLHEDTVEVIAFAHGRRRPGYWKAR